MTTTKPSVLSGVRVLDFGHYIAAPILTRMMSDMGAEIIKIELAPRGDLTRVYPYIKAGQSGGFIQHNRGKQSVCVNLQKPEAVEIIEGLVPQVDVVIENFSPGTLAKYGFGYDALKQLNPRLIMCSISGYGQDGPYAQRPGNDTVAQAMSGLMHLTGDPNGSPTYVGIYIADENAGIHGLAAVCAALYYREKTGIGQYIDLSLVESLFHLHDTALQFYVLSDGELNPTRFGAHHYAIAPCGIFKARDGYMVIAVLVHQWEVFVQAIGKSELLQDGRFATPDARVEHRFELVKILEDWLQSFSTRDEPLAILEKVRILSAPVLDIAQIVNHPQMKARGAMQDVPHPGIGPVALPKSPFRFSETTVEIRSRAPLLGEHNEKILSHYLGYSPERIVALTQSGALVQEPLVQELRARGEIA
ncbi:MAG: CoA transferase [Deltaproteobacteria bacterium]|nr:CoA transferase [Deltaproteobacteria bacterium]